jgi:hypothetical protein
VSISVLVARLRPQTAAGDEKRPARGNNRCRVSDYPLVRPTILFLTLFPVAACTTVDPLYCDQNNACTDPARPFCDLAGEYPASNGVAKTCIPSPEDPGSDDGDDDGGGGETIDGGIDEPDGSPQADAGQPCTWSPLEKLANVNSTSFAEYPGSFSSDGLALHFSRSGGTKTEEGGIFVATRESLGGAFGMPSRIQELSVDGTTEYEPELSQSGLEMFYRVDGSIRAATRSSPAEPFGPSEETGLAGFQPSLSGDGLTLYFVDFSNSKGIIQQATRSDVGSAWGEPETVLPTSGYLYADVSPDELRLLITLSAFDGPTIPLAIAERSSIEDEFGPAVPLDEEIFLPNTSATYWGARWDDTQTRMVVAATSDGETDLYHSTCQ